jgi:hypothetical protein
MILGGLYGRIAHTSLGTTLPMRVLSKDVHTMSKNYLACSQSSRTIWNS